MKQKKKTPTVNLCPFIDKFAICEDGQLLILEPHQRRILGEAFRFGKDGRLPYRTVIYSAPKKSGKTAIAGLVALWFGLTVDTPNEIYLLANDLDQAQGRVFSACKGFVERNEVLRREAKILNYGIKFDNGSSILALASDYAGIAGGNQVLSIFDELWAYFSERSVRLWDECTVPPTQPNGVRLIVSYAGFWDESILLQGIFERFFDRDGQVKPGVKRIFDDLPVFVLNDTFCYWDNVGRMAWQSQTYYQSQFAELRPSAYTRLHLNKWTSGEGTFFNPGDWEKCINPNHRPPLANPNLSLWVGLDASVKRDYTAIVSVFRQGDLVCLGPMTVWKPTPEHPMDFETTVENYLKTLSRNFHIGGCFYDPYQLHRSAVTLSAFGIPMIEYPQSSGGMTDASMALFDGIRHRTIRLYADEELTRQANSAAGKETGRGMRLIKGSTGKIDALIALSLAVYGCVTAPESEQPWELPYEIEPQYRINEIGEKVSLQNLGGKGRDAFYVARKPREIWDRNW